MVQHHHSSTSAQLESLPSEVLIKVALNVVEATFFGPPVDITSLLLVSRTVRAKLHSSALYAGVFKLKFDSEALKRRVPSWSTSSALGDECRKRFAALKRIKARQEFRTEDLWTAYLMMLESDGKNEEQLIEWAGISSYLRAALYRKSHEDPTSPSPWFVDMESTSLLLSLMWSTNTRDVPPLSDFREAISSRFFYSFLMAGFRYPSWCGASTHFDASPLISHAQPQLYLEGDGPHHHPCTVTHYGHELTLYPPPPTAGALMAWKAINAPPPLNAPLPSIYNGLPANRSMAIAMGFVGPTQEDLREYDAQARIIPRARCYHVGPSGRLIQPVSRSPSSGSQLLDEEWRRTLVCNDRAQGSKELLAGRVYRPGTLSGRWAGSFMVPEFQQYSQLVSHPDHDISSMPFIVQGMFVDLQEHYCSDSEQVLQHGFDSYGGHDVLNAWFPRDIELQEDATSITLASASTNQRTRYHTLSWPVVENPACGDSHTSSAHYEGATSDGPSTWKQGTASNALHLAAGIEDIIVTGESSPRHSAAWYHCKVLGRVRPRDGLVVLVVHFTHTTPVKYVFRGYVHDRNLVGRWRDTSSDLTVPGYGGPFFLSKVQNNSEAVAA